MGIEIPESLQWVAKYILGAGDWPEGDETAMRRVADGWTTMANALDTVDDDAATALNAALTALSAGETHDAITIYRDKLLSGDDAAFTAIRKWCEKQAEILEDGANDIEHTKLVIIGTMIVAAVEIGAAIATSWTGIGAAAGVAARVAAQVAVRVAIRQLIARMLTRGAAKAMARMALRGAFFEALEEGGIDAAARVIQVAKGDRSMEDFGWYDLGLATFGGAVGGLVGGGLGGPLNELGDAASKPVSKFVTNAVTGTGTELAADLSAQVAATGLNSAITGEEFNLDIGVDTFTSAGAGGLQNAAESGSPSQTGPAPDVPDLGNVPNGTDTPTNPAATTDDPSASTPDTPGDTGDPGSTTPASNTPADDTSTTPSSSTPSTSDTDAPSSPADSPTQPASTPSSPDSGSPDTSAPGNNAPDSGTPGDSPSSQNPSTPDSGTPGDSSPSQPSSPAPNESPSGETPSTSSTPDDTTSSTPAAPANSPSSPTDSSSSPSTPGDSNPSTPSTPASPTIPSSTEAADTPGDSSPSSSPSGSDTPNSPSTPTATETPAAQTDPTPSGPADSSPSSPSSTTPSAPADSSPSNPSAPSAPSSPASTPADNQSGQPTSTTPANPNPSSLDLPSVDTPPTTPTDSTPADSTPTESNPSHSTPSDSNPAQPNSTTPTNPGTTPANPADEQSSTTSPGNTSTSTPSSPGTTSPGTTPPVSSSTPSAPASTPNVQTPADRQPQSTDTSTAAASPGATLTPPPAATTSTSTPATPASPAGPISGMVPPTAAPTVAQPPAPNAAQPSASPRTTDRPTPRLADQPTPSTPPRSPDGHATSPANSTSPTPTQPATDPTSHNGTPNPTTPASRPSSPSPPSPATPPPTDTTPTPQDLDNANRARRARESLRPLTPADNQSLRVTPSTGRPYLAASYPHALVQPVQVVRITTAVTASPTTPPTTIQTISENTQLATDLTFNQGNQFPTGDWLMVDTVPTTDPTTADLTIDAATSPTLTDLANLIRKHLGLPPRANPALTPSDVMRIGSDIDRANLSRDTQPSWADQHTPTQTTPDTDPTTRADSTPTVDTDTTTDTDSTPAVDTDTDLDAIHNQHAEHTPAGISHHRGDPTMGDLPHRVPPDPNHYTADTHITPDGHAQIGNHTLTPQQYAELLRRSGWDGTTPIRLIGCDASTNGFATQLAQELGVDVLAPTHAAWTDTNGNIFSSTPVTNPDGTRSPRIPPDGQWQTHHPNGTTTPAGPDANPPGATSGPLVPSTAVDRSASDDTDNEEDPSAETTPDDDPEATPPPRDRTIPANDPAARERFVDWNRPTHQPPNPSDPEAAPQPIGRHRPDIDAPHRPRANVPDGNAESEKLQPEKEPATVPAPLQDLQPLKPWTEYRVTNENGTETRFFTNGEGRVKWVEATPGSKSKSINGHGPWSGFNPDLSYPLLPDVQYRVPNYHDPTKFLDFHTDEHGQTDAMTGDVVPGGQNSDYRDDDQNKGAQQRAYQEGEAAYPSAPADRELTEQEAEDALVKWAGGHLLANELGGLGEYLNMHPQQAASNSGNARDGWTHADSWRAKEKELAKFAAANNQEIRNYQVRAIRDDDGVPSEVVMRWQEVTYGRDADGNPTESVVTKERVFPNRPGVDYAPVRRYKGRQRPTTPAEDSGS